MMLKTRNLTMKWIIGQKMIEDICYCDSVAQILIFIEKFKYFLSFQYKMGVA